MHHIKRFIQASIMLLALACGMVAAAAPASASDWTPPDATPDNTWYAFAGSGALEVIVDGPRLVANYYSHDWDRVREGVVEVLLTPNCAYAGVTNGTIFYPGAPRGAARIYFRSLIPGVACRFNPAMFTLRQTGVDNPISDPPGSQFVRPMQVGTGVVVAVG